MVGTSRFGIWLLAFAAFLCYHRGATVYAFHGPDSSPHPVEARPTTAAMEVWEPLEITTTDGPIKVSREVHEIVGPAGPTGIYKKIMVGMKIPYAAPPTGALRFMPPTDNAKWTQPRNCDRSSSEFTSLPACYQSKGHKWDRDNAEVHNFIMEFHGGGGGIFFTDQSEDCLYLNVWAPLNDDGTVKSDLMPVIFFIHGGQFQFDSAFNNLYEATTMSLMPDAEAVVVTFNYRLGPFGFLYAPDEGAPGNVGLRDAAQALRWTFNNIERFGGDKSLITLYGADAGAASIQELMTSSEIPRTHYHGAILSSGVLGSHKSFTDPQTAKENTINLSRAVQCVNARCLQSVDAAKIVENAKNAFYPTNDESYFPLTPEASLKAWADQSAGDAAPIFIGFNNDEGAWDVAEYELVPITATMETPLSRSAFTGGIEKFVPESEKSKVMDLIRDEYFHGEVRNLVEFYTDYWYKCDILRAAESLEETGRRAVFKYRIDSSLDVAQKAFPYFGAGHRLELLLNWGRPFLDTTMYSEEERLMSQQMVLRGKGFAGGGRGGGNVTLPVGPGKILSVDKRNAPMVNEVRIPENKCHFIHCLPSLWEWYEKGTMTDEMCDEYLPKPETAGASSLSFSTMTAMTAMVAALLARV